MKYFAKTVGRLTSCRLDKVTKKIIVLLRSVKNWIRFSYSNEDNVYEEGRKERDTIVTG